MTLYQSFGLPVLIGVVVVFSVIMIGHSLAARRQERRRQPSAWVARHLPQSPPAAPIEIPTTSAGGEASPSPSRRSGLDRALADDFDIAPRLMSDGEVQARIECLTARLEQESTLESADEIRTRLQQLIDEQARRGISRSEDR